ncbi:MAG: TadE/TadG family type IV pilus assembly protein [Sulfitobacter sp.]
MYLTWIKTRLAGFARREDGTIAVEAMIILPMMFWAFLSVFSIFDTYRTYTISQKAAFTIGDAISRETAPLDSDYMNGMHGLFEYLSQSQGQSSLRVTSLLYDGNADEFTADWSKARGSRPELTTNDVRSWTDRLPVMPNGERVMLVETWSTYDPPFATGLEQREIKNFVFTRPRFAPRVCWDQCN